MPVPRMRSYTHDMSDMKVLVEEIFGYKEVIIFIVHVLRTTNVYVHSCMDTETCERLPTSGM
jgi:hypothetical protein